MRTLTRGRPDAAEEWCLSDRTLSLTKGVEQRIVHISMSRPTPLDQLWEGLFAVLSRGDAVFFSPSAPLIEVDCPHDAVDLTAEDMRDAFGEVVLVDSPQALRDSLTRSLASRGNPWETAQYGLAVDEPVGRFAAGVWRLQVNACTLGGSTRDDVPSTRASGLGPLGLGTRYRRRSIRRRGLGRRCDPRRKGPHVRWAPCASRVGSCSFGASRSDGSSITADDAHSRVHLSHDRRGADRIPRGYRTTEVLANAR